MKKIQFEPFFSACQDTDSDSRIKSSEWVGAHAIAVPALRRGGWCEQQPYIKASKQQCCIVGPQRSYKTSRITALKSSSKARPKKNPKLKPTSQTKKQERNKQKTKHKTKIHDQLNLVQVSSNANTVLQFKPVY